MIIKTDIRAAYFKTDISLISPPGQLYHFIFYVNIQFLVISHCPCSCLAHSDVLICALLIAVTVI